MVDFDLRGRTVLITGGGSGLGRAVAMAAGAQGMQVAIIDTNAEMAEQSCAAVRAGGSDASYQIVDVRDRSSLAEAVKAFESELGPIYGAVTCAGISRIAQPEDMSEDEWSSVMDINVTGTFNTVQVAGRGMLERRSGSIVLIGSTDSLGGHTLRANYTASKHAVVGLAKSIAIDWGKRGVRVNALAPGVIDTPLLRANNSQRVIDETFVRRIPQGRMSRAEEQANACLFLLSDAASYITGAVLPVDGGLTAGYFNHLSP